MDRPAPPALPGVTHEYVDARGLRMHIALSGPQDAPAVVLVHGWPQHWWAWREVIPLLSGERRVIVPDLRGFGWTDAPHDGYEKEQLASDLLAALDALGVDRVTWVGHDWGAWIGQLAALRAPGTIERMLMVCAPHLWVPRHPRQLLLLTYQGPLSLPMLGPWLAGRMVPDILQTGRGPERLSDADVELFASRVPPSLSSTMYRTFLTRELPAIARGRYADSVLGVPSTLMIGSRDLVTRGIADGPAAGQPNLSVRTVRGVGHWLPEQRAQLIADWVLAG